MKSVTCLEPFKLGLAKRERPTRNESEVLIRICRVGLCGTDYNIFAGKHPFVEYPRVIGHELGGVVEEAGPGSRFEAGQTVTVNPYLACGSCIACRKGKPNACVFIRVLGVHTDGGMCEFIAVPEEAVIDATGLTLDQAAMVEFLAVGAHAVARAGLRGDCRALIVGAGPIGIATGLFARLAGADVTIVDRRPSRLAYAADRLGFTNSFETGPALQSTLALHTDGEMFDVVFDATGSLAAMRQSLSYTASGGSLVLVGVTTGDLVFDDPEFHMRETTLLASRNALAEDFARVIAAIKAGDIPTSALHTQSFAADDISTRLPELIAGADHVLKAIGRFDGARE